MYALPGSPQVMDHNYAMLSPALHALLCLVRRSADLKLRGVLRLQVHVENSVITLAAEHRVTECVVDGSRTDNKAVCNQRRLSHVHAKHIRLVCITVCFSAHCLSHDFLQATSIHVLYIRRYGVC